RHRRSVDLPGGVRNGCGGSGGCRITAARCPSLGARRGRGGPRGRLSGGVAAPRELRDGRFGGPGRKAPRAACAHPRGSNGPRRRGAPRRGGALELVERERAPASGSFTLATWGIRKS